ncbi:MAG: hypothetical protein ACM3YO_02185, partial [Bacteroidota bacterium]
MIRLLPSLLCLIFLAQPAVAAPSFMDVLRTDDRTPILRKKGRRDYPVFYRLGPMDPALSKIRKDSPFRYVLLGEKEGRG